MVLTWMWAGTSCTKYTCNEEVDTWYIYSNIHMYVVTTNTYIQLVSFT